VSRLAVTLVLLLFIRGSFNVGPKDRSRNARLRLRQFTSLLDLDIAAVIDTGLSESGRTAVFSGDFTGIPTRWLLCGIVAEPGKGHSLSGVATVVANCLLRHAVLRSGSDIC